MGKSESGPDMRDCLMYLRQVEKAHDVDITVLLVPDGSEIAPHVTLSVLATRKGRSPWEAGDGWCSNLGWPNRENKTFEGALFRALAEHDAHLERSGFLSSIEIHG